MFLSSSNYILRVYIDALPLVSYGRRSAKHPAERTRPPAMYTGTVVMILAYSAIIGALNDMSTNLRHIQEQMLTITPEVRVAVHTNPFPVPRSFAGNISEERVWRTPYIICLYIHFQLERILEYMECTHATVKYISTIPPKQSVGASSGCTCEQKGTGKP